MDERLIQWRVGVMVLATIISTAILVIVLGDFTTVLQGTYTIHIRFPSAPGVTPQTPVRQFGLLVGRVTDVKVAADRRGALVTAEINDDTILYKDEVCRITGSLLGDAVIEFVPGDVQPVGFVGETDEAGDEQVGTVEVEAFAEEPADQQEPQRIQPGETISGIVATSPLELVFQLEDNLTTAIDAVASAGSEISELADRINTFFESNNGRVARVVDQAEMTLASIDEAAQSFNRVLGDEELIEDLRAALQEMPSVLNETKLAINQTRAAAETFDRNLKNLEGFTEPLGRRGEGLITQVEQSVRRLDGLFMELQQFSRALSDPQGNLGLFIHDQDLYQNLNAAAINLRELTSRMRPVVEDARVITDKLARDPAQLFNVRSALERRSLIK